MGKYEEALERARQGLPMDEVFPELKGSEDERTRKGLVHFILYKAGKLLDEENEHKFVAYLERQKEPLNPEEKMNHPLYLEGFNTGRQVGEVVSQPAEWSEEDEEIREEVIGDLCALKDWIVKYDVNWLANPVLKSIDKRISWLKALHSDSYKNCNSRWKPSDEHPEGGCSGKPNDLLSEPEAEERITITLSSFDIKLIYDALERERNERLSKTPWKNRNPQGYPPQYSHDYNAKPVRQVDSTLRFIKRQIEQMNARKEN